MVQLHIYPTQLIYSQCLEQNKHVDNNKWVGLGAGRAVCGRVGFHERAGDPINNGDNYATLRHADKRINMRRGCAMMNVA